MNNSTYRLTLDMHEVVVQKCLNIKKLDNARDIRITLTDNGKIYEIAEGCSATLRAKKPDDTVLYNSCVIENNLITYQLTNQTSASVGEVECELTLYNASGKQITSPLFTLMVMDTIVSDDEIESTDEFTELQEALTSVDNLNIEVEGLDGGYGGKITVTDKDGEETVVEVHSFKGDKGDTGDSAGFGTPTASLDNNIGTPSVVITASGEDTAKVFDFAFHNLKGEKGDKGDKGEKGDRGERGESGGVAIGGTTGQVLVKASETDYDVAWADNEGGIPTGGLVGQVLAKKTDDDYDTEWVDQTGGGASLPSGGSKGQILAKKSATDDDAEWVTNDGGTLKKAVASDWSETTSYSVGDICFSTTMGLCTCIKPCTGIPISPFSMQQGYWKLSSVNSELKTKATVTDLTQSEYDAHATEYAQTDSFYQISDADDTLSADDVSYGTNSTVGAFLDNVPRMGESSEDVELVPRDADTLGGVSASEYALKSDIDTRYATVSLGALSSGSVGYKSVTLPTVSGCSPIMVVACISKISTVKGNVMVNADFSGQTAYVTYRAFATVAEADSTVVVRALYKKDTE